MIAWRATRRTRRVVAVMLLGALAACGESDVQPLSATVSVAPEVSVSPLTLNTNPNLAPTIAVPTQTAFASDAKPGAGCATFDQAKPAESLPAFLRPLVLGTPYKSLTAGQTHLYYTRIPGRVADLKRVRDVLDARFKAGGLRIFGAEEESGAEAESGYAGAHQGSINVQVLCSGELNLRFGVVS